MTNYNDGNWHGWNGGECPVDERCEVVVMWEEIDGSFCGDKCYASIVAWDSIDAFRVVKEHREPRELWVNEYYDYLAAHPTKTVADRYAKDGRIGCRLYREVIE